MKSVILNKSNFYFCISGLIQVSTSNFLNFQNLPAREKGIHYASIPLRTVSNVTTKRSTISFVKTQGSFILLSDKLGTSNYIYNNCNM